MSDSAKLQWFEKLRGDLPYYTGECLKIRDKRGSITPLVLNAAQKEAHRLLEKQKAEKGWVRALILKARQPGISTYVAARYYNRASMRKGVNVYILSHEGAASTNLFGIVDRYQRHNPIAPHVGVSNAKELIFDKLDSSYIVATAGTKAGGRSRTVSLFHGSEVAFWENARDHFSASVQGVPLMPGTEVILESTSIGASGEFYERCQNAEAGRGDYILIFLPWWLTEEYAREPEFGFQLNSEASEGEVSEEEYAEMYKLSNSQMAWRRSRVIELGDPLLFCREYPATPADAWTAPPGHEPYIPALLVMRARKRQREGVGPLVVGVDPASMGGDRFAVAWRRGLVVSKVTYRDKIDHNEGTAWCKAVIDEDKPARMNIDAGNIGATIITNLKGLGPKYAEIVRGVNFGGTSQHRLARPKVPGPYNRRAEMWMRSKDWLMLEEGVSIPDDGALQTDATSAKQEPMLSGFFVLESKIKMRARRVRSPDLWDAVGLTFASTEWLTNYSEAPKVQIFGNPDALSAAAGDAAYRPLATSRRGWMR